MSGCPSVYVVGSKENKRFFASPMTQPKLELNQSWKEVCGIGWDTKVRNQQFVGIILMLSYGIVVNNNIIAQVMETNYLRVSLSSWVKLTEDVMHLAKIARKVSG
jgi:hypothetical protein